MPGTYASEQQSQELYRRKQQEMCAKLREMTGDEWEWCREADGYEPVHTKGVKVDRVDGAYRLELDFLTEQQLKEILELLS